jgi:enoyl-CoA hydratase/carnithine racemase
VPDRYRDAITVSWDGPVVDVVLNRPEKFNALNRDVLEALLAVQAEVRANPEVRVLKLSGAGRVFCAGADLEYIRGIYTDAAASRSYLYTLRDAIIGMERLPIPVVTAVHGVVLAGGLELMLGCDIVVAAESTRIGDQHMNYGFIPGGGSTQRLPRHVGPARARDLLFTGRWLSAQDAWHMGLVSRVVPDAELGTATSELADELATRSPHAMSRTKELVRRADDAGFRDGLDLEIESVLGFYNAPEFAASLEAFRTRKSAGS